MLDVDEVIDRVKERLVDRGLTIVENVPIPETDRQIVLMEAPQLRQLRTIYAFANPVAQWLLAAGRPSCSWPRSCSRPPPARMTVWIGAVVAANALLLALALSVGQQLFINALAGTTSAPPARVFYDTLLGYLERGQEVVLWLGLILVVAGLFAGANRYGNRGPHARSSGGLESIGSKVAGTGIDPIAATGPLGRSQRRMAAGGRRRRSASSYCSGATTVTVDGCSGRSSLVIVLLAVLQVLVGAGKSPAASQPVPPAGTVPGTAK